VRKKIYFAKFCFYNTTIFEDHQRSMPYGGRMSGVRRHKISSQEIVKAPDTVLTILRVSFAELLYFPR